MSSDPKPDLDVFVANFGDPSSGQANTILTNDGDGDFEGNNAPAGTRYSTDIALGDFDGDGDLDAIVTNADGQNQVLVNDGSGIFTVYGTPDGSFFSRGVALGDLDGDERLDAFVANTGESGAYNQVLINQGGGTDNMWDGFDAAPVYTGGARQSWDVALGDLDGDGTLDAYVANNGTDQILFNDNGDGNFTRSVDVSAAAGHSGGVALGDLDGDGDLDIFVAVRFDDNLVLINQGGDQQGDQGTFQPATNQPPSGDAVDSSSVALGDLDGDGDLDAIVTNADGRNQVLVNDGTGTFTATKQPLLTDTRTSWDVALGDLDGDGDLDAYIANGDVPDQILWNLGVRDRGPLIFRPEDVSDDADNSVGVALGDLDGDGELPVTGADDLPYLGEDFFGV